jgi:hypothetical protein
MKAIPKVKLNPHMDPVGDGYSRLAFESIEPVPSGSFVALAFVVEGYEDLGDGRLAAKLLQVDRDGNETGLGMDYVYLRPDEGVGLQTPVELWDHIPAPVSAGSVLPDAYTYWRERRRSYAKRVVIVTKYEFPFIYVRTVVNERGEAVPREKARQTKIHYSRWGQQFEATERPEV